MRGCIANGLEAHNRVTDLRVFEWVEGVQSIRGRARSNQKKMSEEWTDYGPFSKRGTLPFSRVKRLARGRVFAVE